MLSGYQSTSKYTVSSYKISSFRLGMTWGWINAHKGPSGDSIVTMKSKLQFHPHGMNPEQNISAMPWR